MAADFQLKVMSYNADGDKTATKNFAKIPASVEADLDAAKGFVRKYAALTNADATTANLIKTTPLVLD